MRIFGQEETSMPTHSHAGQLQRYRDALIGLVVGDALETILEFTRPESFKLICSQEQRQPCQDS